MSDALQQLAGIEGLPSKEVVLARAVIKHGLAQPDQVLDAARAVAGDPDGGGVLQRLTASGALSPERAQKVEAAFRKQVAARQAGTHRQAQAGAATSSAEAAPAAKAGSPGEGGAKRSGEEDAEAIEEAEAVEEAAAAEDGGDATEAATEDEKLSSPDAAPEAAPDTAPDAAPDTAPDTAPDPAPDAAPDTGSGDSADGSESTRRGPRMWKPKPHRESSRRQVAPRRPPSRHEIVDAFVEKFVRSRLHQYLLANLAPMRAGVADPKALAKTTGAKKKEVVDILRDWRLKGILKTVGEFPFYYDPREEHKKAIELFLRAWRDPGEHPRLLVKIMEYEDT